MNWFLFVILFPLLVCCATSAKNITSEPQLIHSEVVKPQITTPQKSETKININPEMKQLVEQYKANQQP